MHQFRGFVPRAPDNDQAFVIINDHFIGMTRNLFVRRSLGAAPEDPPPSENKHDQSTRFPDEKIMGQMNRTVTLDRQKPRPFGPPPPPMPSDESAGSALADGSTAVSTGVVAGLALWDGRWWVLHTKPRQERVLAKTLASAGVRHFLPLIRRCRTSGRRRVDFATPIFPGYVFLCGDDADRLTALRTNRIARVLEVPDQDGLRRDLSHVWRIVDGDCPVELYPGLREGCRCQVISGSLAGLEGIVLRRRGPWRVYVAVTFLGQSAELEIEPDRLRVVD